jgi:hypothetical protein
MHLLLVPLSIATKATTEDKKYFFPRSIKEEMVESAAAQDSNDQRQDFYVFLTL